MRPRSFASTNPNPDLSSQIGKNVKFLISNLGDGRLQLAELTAEGKLRSLGKATVGEAPKRVAFLPLVE